MSDNNIIIKKVKKSSHAHHGGAWKVAYADFVTAMMAFFLLLWLLSAASKEQLQGIAKYFTPTVGIKDGLGIGFTGGLGDVEEGEKRDNAAKDSLIFGTPDSGAVIKMPPSSESANEVDAHNFTAVQNDLYKAIHDNPELQEFKENILIDQTPEGLRIQLLDKENRPLFVPGTSKLQSYTKEILIIIAKFIKYLPNYLSINGHTNNIPFSNNRYYDNWDLSADRANATRRFFINGYLDAEQIGRIVGKGEQEPLANEPPESYKNMRISLILLRNMIVPYQKQSAPETLLR